MLISVRYPNTLFVENKCTLYFPDTFNNFYKFIIRFYTDLQSVTNTQIVGYSWPWGIMAAQLIYISFKEFLWLFPQ